MLPQRITFQHPPSRANSFPHRLFRTLCRFQKAQLLWNQANPNSFSKTPGVGIPNSTAGRPEQSARNAKRLPASTFRMNTCKSVSKQTTLSTFRMNTYEIPGGGGRHSRSRLTPVLFRRSQREEVLRAL